MIEQHHFEILERRVLGNPLDDREKIVWEQWQMNIPLAKELAVFEKILQGFQALAIDETAEALGPLLKVEDVFDDDIQSGFTALQIEALSSKLNQVQKEHKKKSTKRLRLRSYLAIAASILVLLGIGLFFLGRANFSDEAIMHSFLAETSLPQTRSADLLNPFDQAITAIKNKEFEQALSLLESISEVDNDYTRSVFWKAHCQIQLNNYEKALHQFDRVVSFKVPQSPLAEWNAVIAAWKLDRDFSNRLMHITNDSLHPYYEKALEFEKKIKHPLTRVF